MEASFLSSVVLPLAIALIMVAMGMTLTLNDLWRVLTHPKEMSIGLICQMILLPLIGFLVVSIFPLTSLFAISIILVAASPGGTTSNLITHVAEGDRALSVSLTVISNAVTWLTIPFLLNIALRVFGEGEQAITLPVGEVMLQIAALTLVPVTIGMIIRHFRPGFCERVKNPSKIFAMVFLFVVIFALVIQNWDQIVTESPRFAPAFITLNILALIVGYAVPRLAGLDTRKAATIGIETGVQNTTLTITIAFTVFNSGEMAIIPGLYGLWMLVTGFIFAFYLTRGQEAKLAEA
ncbi:MAG: bile acid:sodium symporter family protein [Chloroflexota bacterium]